MPNGQHVRAAIAALTALLLAAAAAHAAEPRQASQASRHWAFITPTRPALPDVQRAEWPRNPIDRFILARLEAEGLAPSPEADRRTLIRRLTLDLTGLPPTAEQVEAFVHDDDPDAYEKLVSRLLDSPHYGEHMARYWLDAARYGDTHGLHLDNYREMWPYRDWVIRAFNANLPFDRFTIQQIAGDLLPEPVLDDLIATGFNRAHVSTNEGGSIVEEVYVRNIVDRVETTGTVFLGLTLGCAVCHDHKYDPLSMKDFYSLFAFFNSLDGPAMDGNRKDPPPVIAVPTAEQQQRHEAILARIDAARRRLERRIERVRPAYEAWLDWRQKMRSVPDHLSPAAQDLARGLVAHYPLDAGGGTDLANAADETAPGRFYGEPKWIDGKFGKALDFDGEQHAELGRIGDFERDRPFSYGAWVRTDAKHTGAPIARMDDGDAHRGWDLYITGRRVAMHLIHAWPHNAIKVTTKEDALQPDTWHHVFITYDGSGKAAGVRVYADGEEKPTDVNADALTDTTRTDTPLRLGRRNPGAPFRGDIDEVRIYDRKLGPTEVAELAGGDPIGPILALAPDQRTEQQKQTLRRYYLERYDPVYRDIAAEIDAHRAEAKKLEEQFPTTLVFRERAEPRPAYILKRGQYDQRSERVERDTPDALPPMDEALPRDRLGLAKWLVDETNPLTARVAVNRFWQQVFGTGIVKTAEDFGTQGEPPSHPELLDWLAVEFRQSGWDVKRLMKLIVTSAAYRQSSAVTPELYRKDPANRLLARGPRFRLDAEAIRDQALALGGLLVRTFGGPSVKPPQPEGLWYAVGYTRSNTAKFEQDHGAKTYRRSVYTFWKRTAPPPQMTTFDAPSRESCTVRRERTNTPLQALALLNEQQFVEAARHLAARTLREAGPSPQQRAEWMFTAATARPPDQPELAELLALYERSIARFREDPAAAERLIAHSNSPPDPGAPGLDPPQLAAWTLAANLILNLDEVITKE